MAAFLSLRLKCAVGRRCPYPTRSTAARLFFHVYRRFPPRKGLVPPNTTTAHLRPSVGASCGGPFPLPQAAGALSPQLTASTPASASPLRAGPLGGIGHMVPRAGARVCCSGWPCFCVAVWSLRGLGSVLGASLFFRQEVRCGSSAWFRSAGWVAVVGPCPLSRLRRLVLGVLAAVLLVPSVSLVAARGSCSFARCGARGSAPCGARHTAGARGPRAP